MTGQLYSPTNNTHIPFSLPPQRHLLSSVALIVRAYLARAITAVEVEGIRAWIRAGHVKRAQDKDAPQRWIPLLMDPGDGGLKLRLRNSEFLEFIIASIVKISVGNIDN